MGVRISFSRLLIATACACLPASISRALLKFNEGHDRIFVKAETTIGFDSNIDSASNGSSDIVSTSSLAVEYTRHAGMIGVNGNVMWTLGRFAENASEDFADPSLGLELVKETGRTTGSFTLNAARQNQSDPTLNQRTESWNYNAGLNWKYPVIDRYSLSGSLGAGLLDYTDNSTGQVDLNTQYASVDLYYTYNSQRDLFAGYRIRKSDTSSNSQLIDHAFTAGVSGKVISKLNGSVRGGYQFRNDLNTGETFQSTTASASVTWAVNKRFTITGTLSKDFNTTGSDSSSDNLTFDLNAQYVLTPHWTLFTGIGAGTTDFLSGVDNGRRDQFATWNVGVNYTMNEHFKASLTYSYLQNWSNRSIANFDRSSISLYLSTRW
jgi:hypothetical protein